MTARDPRSDPRPGDVLRKGERTRIVLSAKPLGAGFMVSYNSGKRTHDTWISTWREWCRGAEVVRVSTEGEGA